MTDQQIMDLWRCYNQSPGRWGPILDFAHALLQNQPLAQSTLDGHDFRLDPPDMVAGPPVKTKEFKDAAEDIVKRG